MGQRIKGRRSLGGFFISPVERMTPWVGREAVEVVSSHWRYHRHTVLFSWKERKMKSDF